MVEEYLGEDWKQKLKEMGGIEDKSGIGGLSTEVIQEEPQERIRQKAKSAATLYLDSQRAEDINNNNNNNNININRNRNEKYEAYGCSESDELVEDRNWSGQVVLMMQKNTN